MTRPGKKILPATSAGIRKCADCISSGGVVVYPTETVYGLGADPFNPSALNRVFAIKGREKSKSLILLLPDQNVLHKLVNEIPDDAYRLIEALWPGPLTLVLRGREELPAALLGPDNSIAVRISDSPVCADLLSLLGNPITSTSANRSGYPPVESAPEAHLQFGEEVDMILDGGEVSNTQPSTLVRITDRTEILREGRIPNETINKLLRK